MAGTVFPSGPGPRDLKQPRICDVLGWSCHHPKGFFDRPRQIRRKIYLEAGILRDDEARCVDDGATSSEVDNQSCTPFQVHDRDLLTKHETIVTDIMAQMRGGFCLALHSHSIDHGLLFLLRLPAWVCSRLTDLTLTLHEQHHQRQYQYNGWYRISEESMSASRLSVWKRAIRHILCNSPAQTLRLHLVCETGNSRATHEVAQPLLDSPGVLKSFEISLGRGA